MGGFLKTLTSVAEIAGGVALEFVPGGQLAGAMLITAGIGSSGLIGGSVGKFLNSGAGQALMGAMAMGAGAVYSYGMDAAQAAQGASAAQTATAGNISANAATDAQAAITSTDSMASTEVSKTMAGIASSNPDFMAASGTTAGSDAAAYAGTPAASSGPGAAAAQTSANATAVDANATKAAGAAGNNLVGSPAPPTSAPTPGSTANNQLAGGAMNGTPSPSGLYTPNVPDVPNGGAPLDSPQTQGGFLSKAMNYVGKNPGVAVMAGQALSGAAQGAAQEKMNQQQIAAQQWGNLQWQNPAEVNQLQAAAAKPITVPQGYLQRAQAVRGMMSQPVGGVQPLPAASPGAPLAPNPVHV